MSLENIAGGFSAVYDVLKALEESGRVRRGYFVAGLGGAQFALPSAIDLLRSLRTDRAPEKPEMLCLAATDPANLYGSVLRWPSTSITGEVAASQGTRDAALAREANTRILARAVGARVILRNGELVAYMRRSNPNLTVFLAPDEPDRSHVARDLANFLVELGQQDLQTQGSSRVAGLLLATVNDVPIAEHFLARFLLDAGFHSSPMGFHLRRPLLSPIMKEPAGSASTREVQ
jgi:ATP-dependent Lhr-like helicase